MKALEAAEINLWRNFAQALGVGLVVACLALPACAQFAPRASRPQVTVAPVDTIDVLPGKTAPLTIDLQVNRGFHINSHRPNQDYLLPTVVHLDPPDGIMIVNIAYPEAQDLTLPFAGADKMSVYSGNFEVTADVRASRSAAYGKLRVHGQVRYQACDNRQCFPPRNTPFEFDVRVVHPRSARPRHITPQSPHVR